MRKTLKIQVASVSMQCVEDAIEKLEFAKKSYPSYDWFELVAILGTDTPDYEAFYRGKDESFIGDFLDIAKMFENFYDFPCNRNLQIFLKEFEGTDTNFVVMCLELLETYKEVSEFDYTYAMVLHHVLSGLLASQNVQDYCNKSVTHFYDSVCENIKEPIKTANFLAKHAPKETRYIFKQVSRMFQSNTTKRKNSFCRFILNNRESISEYLFIIDRTERNFIKALVKNTAPYFDIMQYSELNLLLQRFRMFLFDCSEVEARHK